MAGSRRSVLPDLARDAGDPLGQAVARSLVENVTPGARIAVALSGGRDSVALLVALADAAQSVALDIVAIHVHHGLSADADHWLTHCRGLADSIGVPLLARHVDVDSAAALGIEAAARKLRYAALASAAREAGALAVMLAHHQDDQAETLLLQLSRGAGVHGLAGMPRVRRDAAGLLWLRPLLELPRSDIDAFVRRRELSYVDDDSNLSTRHLRNALRAEVVPALAATFTGYPATFARAAMHQAEAARLVDELAEQDAGPLVSDGMLSQSGLASLPSHRARNLLRWFLRGHNLRAPSTARLDAILIQLQSERTNRRVRLRHDGAEIGIHRGRIVVHGVAPPAYQRAWHGEAALALPHGRLGFVPVIGEGLSASSVAGRPVVVRPRAGGERLQLWAARPRRALKSWLQEASLPAWERESLPLVFCGEVLAAVPGIGVDVGFQAANGTAGFLLDWLPAGPSKR